jgi:RHS repeat-associated protein
MRRELRHSYQFLSLVRSTISSGNRYTFTGEENDASGLVYLRARYYNPVISAGRGYSRVSFDPT